MADAAQWDADQDVDLGRSPDHVPQLHKAMAEAAADLDAVEDRLSTLFERTEGPGRVEAPRTTSAPVSIVDDDAGETEDDLGGGAPVVTDRMAIIGEYEDDIGGDFAELDAELAAEEPDEPARKDGKGKHRKKFGRRSKGTTAGRG